MNNILRDTDIVLVKKYITRIFYEYMNLQENIIYVLSDCIVDCAF